FPLALVVSPPRIRRRQAILIRPWEDIPIGRLYRTHPGDPCRALTTRKSVMAALVISISLDVSVESVGSSFSRVIIIGFISVELPVAPKVGAAAAASPVEVLELDTHLSSVANPSESSSPLISVAPMVSPFLCLDDSESDTEIPERHVSPTPHEAMLTRWRSRVALRSSSPTTYIPEIPTTPILPAPSAIEDIPIGRLYHTHPGGQCRALTARKSVRPLPSHRLALSEAYLRWSYVLLSTMYPPTTSESSAGDSSFESSAGPSRKRCRSPSATVISSINATRALILSRADLLLPQDEVEDEVESSDRGTIDVGVDVIAMIDIPDGMLMPDDVEHLEQVEEVLQDIYDHVIQIPL
nr:hypothetical protein [Tanacetum cinerariifolium]